MYMATQDCSVYSFQSTVFEFEAYSTHSLLPDYCNQIQQPMGYDRGAYIAFKLICIVNLSVHKLLQIVDALNPCITLDERHVRDPQHT